MNFSLQINAQISNYNTNQNGTLEVNFLRDKTESKAQSTIFNILKIKNTSDKPFSGKISISVPLMWSIIGDDTYEVQLNSQDSLNLPVRISISKNAIGDIGYSIVGTITDIDGKTVKSAYTFVTIPRLTNFTTKPAKRINYISKAQKQINFDYILNNRGNVNELIHLEAYSTGDLSIEGSDEYAPYVAEYSLPANSDTIVSLKISKIESVSENSLSSVKISATGQDTTFNQTFWIKILDNIYTYQIPETQKCAIMEIFAHNLLSTTNPYYSLLLKGQILFKKNNDVYYFYRNYNIGRSIENSNFGINYRAYVGYKNKFSELRLGSIETNFEQNIYGYGADLKLNYLRNSFEGVYVQDIYNRFYTSGGQIKTSVMGLSITGGGVYTDIYENSVKTILGYGGIGFSFLRVNSISLIYGYNTINQQLTDEIRIGQGLSGNYNFNHKKLKINIMAFYGDKYYIGKTSGRFNITGQANYKLSKTARINAKYLKNDNLGNYDVYSNSTYDYSRESNFYYLDFTKQLNRQFTYQIGPVLKTEKTDQFSASNQIFSTLDTKLFMSANIRTKYSQLVISPRINFGVVKVNFEDTTSTSETPLFNTFDLNLAVYKNNLGIFTSFRYGPFNINEYYLYYSSGYFAKWFFLMPYYSDYLLDNKLKIDIRANYINNISSNENAFSLTNNFSLFLPWDITIYFLNSFTSRSRIERSSNVKYSYNSIYFELGLRKEFNCDQPRIQYHNLDVIFFRDMNGNRVKDKNEPGISNIYANIIRDFNKDESELTNGFSEAELMSDQFGEVEYINIPNGDYIIKYQLLGDITGNYSLEELETNVTMDDDKIVYIPYLENNKIIGKVVLNRDPLSSLGPIDISNIRVIAEDTEGRTYSALTNFAGNFTLYTPKTDHYVVRINNVFYESFDLQQSEFIVKFNGYKQFEVTFVFDEKKRKINFEDNVVNTDVVKMDELQVIKKTTLTGKIRDAISLEPIEAKVEIIDNKTNKVVSSAISNRLNGNYSISYVAGDHFRIEVKAQGHWDHVENLYIEQIISIQNIAKDIIMNKLSDGPKQQTFIIYDEKQQDEFKENFKPGQKIPVNNLNFEEKETRLSPNAYPDLDRLIDVLKKNPTVKIEIGGHANDTESERTDNLLALRRAKAVAKYLTEHGIPENRIEVKSYSNQRPIVSGTSERTKQKNRRVEIIVL